MRKPNLLRAAFRMVAFSVLSVSFMACVPTEQPSSDTPATVTKQPVTAAPEVLTEQAPAPLFSAPAGFYENAFFLELSNMSGGQIYFTADGSDPRTSDTAKPYTDGILLYNNTYDPNVYSAITDIMLREYHPPQFPIDKGIVIRAVTKTSKGEFSPVVTNSYFIGKTASYYSDIKVISLVTDSDYLFHPDTGAYMVGSGYYAWKNSSDYVDYDPNDVQNPTNYNADGKESEFPVSVQVFDNKAPVYTADVGARISGNWSRSYAQKSIRFYAGKEYGTSKMKYAFFDGLTGANGDVIQKFDKITLRNTGNDCQELHFRDALIHDLTKNLSLDYMAAEPYLLFLNGEFWGFYFLREKPEDYYIQSHYEIDKEQVALIKNGKLESGTEEDLGDYWNFCNWAAVADMTLTENYNEFCSRMDLQSFMDYMAVETYVNNSDWATGYINNWMVWRSCTVNPDLPRADGKWRFILYDLDFSSGIYDGEQNSYRYDSLNNIYTDSDAYNQPAILRNLSKNPEFLQAFRENYLRVIDTCFNPDIVNARIEEYARDYGEAIKATFRRFDCSWAADNFDRELVDLQVFYEKRPDFARHYLNLFCGIESELVETYGENLLPDTATWTYYGNAAFSSDCADNSFHVTVAGITEKSWDIQSQTPKLTLEKGGEYRLSFDASLAGNGSLGISINRQDGNDYPNCFWGETALSDKLQTYEYHFVMKHDTNDDWKLCFNYGAGQGDFLLKNVTLTKLQ